MDLLPRALPTNNHTVVITGKLEGEGCCIQKLHSRRYVTTIFLKKVFMAIDVFSFTGIL